MINELFLIFTRKRCPEPTLRTGSFRWVVICKWLKSHEERLPPLGSHHLSLLLQ